MTTFSEPMMTVVEIAEAMNVSKDTIWNVSKKLFPDKIKQGKVTFFSEEEVACISREVKSNSFIIAHNSNPSGTVEDSPTVMFTGKELEQNYYKAAEAFLRYLQSENQKITQERDALKIELDEDKEWATVKRMEALNKQPFAWSSLKKYSKENGYEIKKTYDQNYGSVNTYHKDVWEAVYGQCLINTPWEE